MLDRSDAFALVDVPVAEICEDARRVRRGRVVTYSPKVFIPLTHLCRDVCHYCTFARPPRRGERAYMTEEDVQALRAVSVSQGLMLEGSAPALFARGGPHFGSPDKRPEARLATIAAAGEARVPFTTGILVGIGETRAERLEALFAIRDLHD